MSHIDVDTTGGGVQCKVHVVRLDLTADLIDTLIRQGHGAIWYPGSGVGDGAVYVSHWFYDNSVMIAFHVEMARPDVIRRFVLVPMHHAFMRDPGVELHPLGLVAVPTRPNTLLLTLYEAIDAIRTDEIAN